MGEEFVANLLSNVGIPAAICFYTLFGVNKTLKELTAAINKQTADIERREIEQSSEISMLKDKINELAYKVEKIAKEERYAYELRSQQNFHQNCRE